GGNNIEARWEAAFATLGMTPQVQSIENAHAQHYWAAGLSLANEFQLQSEPGLALCFDIAVQDRVTDEILSEISARTAGGISEPEKMGIIAHVIAHYANPRYYDDVLKRKLTFANGQGRVHGELYDI